MKWIFSETQNSISPSQPPQLSPLKSNTSFDLSSKISPNILLIIIILSTIFFISGLIHILVKFLLTPSTQNGEDYLDNNVTALQGQLQQLFHLHDSGVDQSMIDTLPVFHYNSIIGLEISSFDCPVCLCEFETEDKLRLLPKCSHAFHVDCIDTWLLSHSTCPLCRFNLLSGLSSHHNPSSSYLLLLESGQSSREMVPVPPSQLGFDGNNNLGSTRIESDRKSCDPDSEFDEKVVPLEVKLGKFRNIDHIGQPSNNDRITGNSNVDGRRCLSMGSYQYIMEQEATLKVHVSTKKLSGKDPSLPGHRAVMSECGFDPTVKGIEKSVVERESFSLSKIWLRGRKEKQKGTSARDQDSSSVSSSSIQFWNRWNPTETKNGIGIDEENQKSENVESLEMKTPSFARRTMLWLAGRQNKVVHPSSTSNV